MNNKKQQAQTFLSLALLSGFMVAAGSAQAGAFMTPTTNAAGWGRAFGGGSLFKNDPSSAYNNPAAIIKLYSVLKFWLIFCVHR